jgi:hypothetical protein
MEDAVKAETRQDTKVCKGVMALTRITADQNYMQQHMVAGGGHVNGIFSIRHPW